MIEENEIIKYLKQGDAQCMRMIFDAYYQPLCIYALKYMISFEDAEDIVQELLIAFWENKRNTHFSGSVGAYLFGATHKACLNQLKSSGRFLIENIGDYSNRLIADAHQINDEGAVARRNKLQAEIDRLPEKSREIFMAIVLDNMQYKEVAEKYGISVNTVKTQYARALKQLRDNLDQIILLLLTTTRREGKGIFPGHR